MTTLIIRNLEDNVGAALKQEAIKRTTSVNKLVQQYISQGLRSSATNEIGKPAHDLSRFAGSWTARQHQTFMATIEAQRVIEPDLWR